MMEKLIHFFIENPKAMELLQKNELSLVGVSPMEQQAAINAFEMPLRSVPIPNKWR